MPHELTKLSDRPEIEIPDATEPARKAQLEIENSRIVAANALNKETRESTLLEIHNRLVGLLCKALRPKAPILHASGGLIPVLLDSRGTDADRHRGVWVAVPPANIRVL